MRASLIIATLLLGCSAVYADTETFPDAPVTPSTIARDPRLPPVIPGEVVTTENGDKIKVWSSSGPVHVDHPPVQNYDNNGSQLPPGVIVDTRKGR